MFTEAVLMFGTMLAVFEFVLLSMLPPKYRLRLLGSRAGCNAVHASMLVLNMWIHWGTVIGTMSATLSFCASVVTVFVARIVYGTIENDVRTRRGLVGYKTEELVL